MLETRCRRLRFGREVSAANEMVSDSSGTRGVHVAKLRGKNDGTPDDGTDDLGHTAAGQAQIRGSGAAVRGDVGADEEDDLVGQVK